MRLNTLELTIASCVLILSACAPKSSDEDGGTESGASTGETSDNEGEETGAGDTTSDAGGGDTTDNETTPGGSTEDTGESSGDTGSPGTQHPDCTEPFPEPAPVLPGHINLDPAGAPAFAGWQDLACDDPDVEAVSTCSESGGCGSNHCLLSNGSYGVCTDFDIDIWCDGEGEVIGYSDGDCWMCASLATHARACCEYGEESGWDCRMWPFPADGPPGSVCARHEDCEPGLVCGDHTGEGYGICQCPGLPSDGITPADGCY